MRIAPISKKGQPQTQIFIYIMVLVIGAGILVFGYKAISGIKESADSILYAKFQSSFEHDIRSISYQGVQTKKYELPTNVQQVCFRAPSVQASTCTLLGNVGNLSQPRYSLISQAITDCIRDSVFLHPKGNSFYPGKDLDVDSSTTNELKFRCIDVRGGVLQVRITGQGNSVLIEP